MLKAFRIIIIAGTLLMVSAGVHAQHAFTIKGKLTDTSRNGEKIILSYHAEGKSVYTAVIVKDGAYELKGMITEPVKASLSMPLPKAEFTFTNLSDKAEFYMEADTVYLEGRRLASSVIKAGGRPQQDFLALKAVRKPFDERERTSYKKMLDALIAKDSISKEVFRVQNEQAKRAVDSVERAFISTHPNSFVSLTLLEDRATTKGMAEEKENIAKLYKGLSQPIQQSIVGKQIAERIQMAYKLQPGSQSIDFTMNDTLDKPVSLSSFRGKYVLLDFWASWCIPCRGENKTVVKAYQQFKDKNFTVLSVSLDQAGQKKAWTEAIRKDSLTWTNVSDLASMNNKAAVAYGVKSIPMNFLIDPKGKIIALHLRGEALMKKLEQVLAN
jgi:peroxiredoxin